MVGHLVYVDQDGANTQIARFEMLNGNYDMLKSENSELQKRNQALSELQAKLDLRSQQIEEELMDSKSSSDGMRSEIARLKAEKDLFKSIEERLSRDNESLLDERAKLNSTISSLQSMQNERERVDGEVKRRFEMQITNLESELTSTKKNDLLMRWTNPKRACLEENSKPRNLKRNWMNLMQPLL